ncbi:MAG: DUF2752 domain-containing protein [Thermoguttaceae bacterium]
MTQPNRPHQQRFVHSERIGLTEVEHAASCNTRCLREGDTTVHTGFVLPFLLLGLFVVGTVFVLVLLYWKHPTDYGFPSCPTRTVLHLYCPGCGSMRAVHFFLNGNIKESLRYNPLVILFLPVILVLLIRFWYETFTKRSLLLPYERLFNYFLLIVILLFCVARNVPLSSFDLLRPPSRPVIVPQYNDLGPVSIRSDTTARPFVPSIERVVKTE